MGHDQCRLVLGVAGAVFIVNGNAALGTGIFVSSFVTLSILTVPHMLMPMIAGQRMRAHRLALA